jgi:hypothetical protein
MWRRIGGHIMNIYQKLIEVRKSVPYLQKSADGPQFKYVSSSQVLANVKAKMDELGLLLVPKILNHEVREHIKPEKGTITYFTELDIEYTWINAEKPEEVIVCSFYGQGVDIAGEKGVGKALTYAEKYFMLKFFNIPTDKDDPDRFQDKHTKEEEQESNLFDAPQTKNDCISESQAKRLFALSKGNTHLVKEVLLSYNYTSSKDIKKSDYNSICEDISRKA